MSRSVNTDGKLEQGQGRLALACSAADLRSPLTKLIDTWGLYLALNTCHGSKLARYQLRYSGSDLTPHCGVNRTLFVF